MKLDDDIHNYYEKLLLDHLVELRLDDEHDTEYLADLCCIVLNQLPPKYIRYEVDMAFYLPQTERFEMVMKVREAVAKAKGFLDTQRDKN
ncbi:MAG: late competence development ComFB family protein [Gammaproteobacteria bacterium]|nr:late competence development ComFB family protein [Gammaproteobacteria bacterium]MBU2058827.1 late competence development ComFB family protein [Gammaproteobacteria bacterium]MBU2177110.1 late competence development ComFB family protein [Gammaproteobacteria bacterium]MBU2247096.1 late competence development ComFB family protein [Gammaproteobacteria bacterium]MBU2343588.1 late competence development ComFB family protein [Gammaproteobacteria bacterium]